MKKLFTIAIAFLATMAVNAQEKQYGPEEGDFAVEVEFNPFSNNFRTFQIDGLKVRYSLSDKDIIRAKLGLSLQSHTQRANLFIPEDGNPGTYNGQATYDDAKTFYDKTKGDFTKDKTGSFSLDLGYERMLYKKGRLNIYAGAEIGFEKGWASRKQEATGLVGTEWKTNTRKTKGESIFYGTNSRFDFNIGAFTGLDFYIVKGLYMGAELGLGFNTSTSGNVKTKNTVWTSATNKTETETETNVKNKDFSGRLDVNPALRIGWTF